MKQFSNSCQYPIINYLDHHTGKSRKDFADQVKPYLKMAAQMADKMDIDTMLSF